MNDYVTGATRNENSQDEKDFKLMDKGGVMVEMSSDSHRGFA